MGSCGVALGLGVVLVSMLTVAAQWEDWPTPPIWEDKPRMSRYLAHYSSWGVLSAYSPQYGYPFGSVVSLVDGSMKNSTGIPYMYLSDNGDTYAHITHNNSASLTVTMAESELCKKNGMDPLEPLCARMVLLGHVVAVKDPAELAFSTKALFTRHPAMQYWPKGHGWHVYKLETTGILLLDFYGGAAHIALKDYFNVQL